MRPSEVFEKYREDIRKIAKRYEPRGITNFRICGSVANGTDTDSSDLDFIVDADETVDLFTLGHLYHDLSSLLECEIDLVASEDVHPFIRKHMLKRVIYI